MARPTPPPPPRWTGDPDSDNAAMISWFTDFYKSVVQLDQEDTGTATISDLATTVEVSGFVAQSNTDYRVTATPQSSSGTPAAGAYTIQSIANDTDKFTITVSAAPGTGNSVTFAWHIKR